MKFITILFTKGKAAHYSAPSSAKVELYISMMCCLWTLLVYDQSCYGLPEYCLLLFLRTSSCSATNQKKTKCHHYHSSVPYHYILYLKYLLIQMHTVNYYRTQVQQMGARSSLVVKALCYVG
jgi:hypothetical protein